MNIRKKTLKIALLFHGQGLEPAKGIETLREKDRTLDRIIGITCRQTRSFLGEELFERVISSGREERTADTQLSQLAVTYEGTILARAFLHYKPKEGAPSVAELYYGNNLNVVLAGHSVGGTVASGFEPLLSARGKVIDSGRFKKTVELVKERGRIMLEHHKEHPDAYCTGVVIKKSDEFCDALVQLARAECGGGSVSVSGHNSASIHTIAGKVEAVTYALQHAKSSGATVVERLNDYGFHDYGIMHECALQLKDFLNSHKEELRFNSYFPVLSSRNAKTLRRARALRADFWKGVEEPVMWHCGGSDHKNPGRGFVVDTLVRQGYNVHVVFARELKGWERELERNRLAEVIAVTDYNSLVEGYSRVLQLVKENASVPYLRRAPAARVMQSAPSLQL